MTLIRLSLVGQHVKLQKHLNSLFADQARNKNISGMIIDWYEMRSKFVIRILLQMLHIINRCHYINYTSNINHGRGTIVLLHLGCTGTVTRPHWIKKIDDMSVIIIRDWHCINGQVSIGNCNISLSFIQIYRFKV